MDVPDDKMVRPKNRRITIIADAENQTYRKISVSIQREDTDVQYMRQFGIILGVTCAGEVLKYFIPLPIPGSIYGLVLMLALLMTRAIKVEHVKDVGEFMIEIMPLMFIPAGVGLMTSWSQLKTFLLPLVVITVVSTFVVMIVTGKVTDFLLDRKGKEKKHG